MEEGSLGDECFDRVQERENEIACLKKKKKREEGKGEEFRMPSTPKLSETI